ncbi:MAG: TonB-dependent receptor [Prevotella sp.]|nr:TonB-dependent receptor [Prevotella sp.]
MTSAIFVQAVSAEAAVPVKGSVVDADTHIEIIGASVRDASGKALAVTDIDGRFEVMAESFPATFEVSYVGYQTQKVTAFQQGDSLTVTLKADARHLDEVVVVGYGTQNRTQLTGSVSTVRANVFNLAQSPTLDEALTGQVAGLNVTASSGQPGASSQLRIRGGNSVNASNEPLYVIDGFIYYKDQSASRTGLANMESSVNPLASVNPTDIQSIEVLKDVSATAIYGSRGANGVIIVTTKKGQRGKVSINYRYTVGWDRVTKKLDLLNASEWGRLERDHYNKFPGYTDEQLANLGQGTDWQDAVLRSALRQSHELSISGGGDRTRYAVSANYTDQDGIVIGSGFRRYNFHINADHELMDNLTLGLNASYGKSTQRGLTTTVATNYNSSPYSAGISNSLVYALMMPPVVTVYNADGGFNYSNPYEYAYFAVGNKTANPVSDLLNSTSESINNYLLSNFYLQYKFLGHFTVKAALGLNKEQVTQNYFSPSYTALGLANEGLGGIGHKNQEIWQQEYTIDYTNQLGAHFVNALVGYTQQRTTTAYNSTLVSHFTNEALGYNNLADGSQVYPPVSGTTESKLQSFIFRLNYTLLGRYNATATFRTDHSSRFSSRHRWGYFPSIGLSWNVSEEPWLRNVRALSGLKLRVSAGTVGNQEIGDYEFAASYAAGRYNGSSSYQIGNLANGDLRWETTASYNFGIDAGFFDNRLNAVLDLYYKKTSDLLLNVPVSSLQGVSSQLRNVGNVVNKGIELSLNGTIVRNRDLSLTATLNLARNLNRITDMGTTDNVIEGDYNERILRQGSSLGSFYGLLFTGIDENGRLSYKDQDGNGVVNGNDRVLLGSVQPDLTLGFSTALQWHHLDASISLAGTVGSKLFNALRYNMEHATDSYNVLASYYSASRTSSYIDSRYVESGNYLKLKNLTLGYTIAPKGWLASFRLFATASNLLTITPYKGYDPEVASGTDNGVYPASRSFVFGVDVKF